MMSKLLNIFSINKKYFIIILGAILISLYFWNRFIRFRVSKPLPLDLNVISFFSTICICIMFVFIIISLIYPKKPNPIVEEIINWIFIPIKEFDKYLKSFSIIKINYEKMLFWCMPTLEFAIIKTNMFFIIFWVFPRILLLSALYIDVFIFHQFHYKYLVVLFGLLLFFNRYIKYSLKNTKESLIEYHQQYIHSITTDYYPGIHPSELEPDYNPKDDDEDPTESMSLPFEVFIKYQTDSIVYKNNKNKIWFIRTTAKLHDEYWLKYIGSHNPIQKINQKVPADYTNIFGNSVPDNYNKANNVISIKIKEFKDKTVQEITQLSVLLEYYNKNISQSPKIKNLKILIYLNYLLCWLYVLIISLPYTHWDMVIETLLSTYIKIEEPFSATFLENDENIS